MPLFGLFGSPNVNKLRAKRDVVGLIKTLAYLKDGSVRIATAKALGSIGDARAVEPLIAALKDRNSQVREAAAEALGAIGAPAIEPLIAALKDGDWDVRWQAAKALGAIGAPAVEPLIAALKYENATVRGGAAKALSETNDSRAVEPLIDALQDGESFVRTNALRALETMGDSRALKPLIGLLYDGESSVRQFAAGMLGRIGKSQAVEPLVNVLTSHEDSDMRQTAARSLGYIADSQAIEPLVTALNDSEKSVRSAAEQSLTIFIAQRADLKAVLEEYKVKEREIERQHDVTPDYFEVEDEMKKAGIDMDELSLQVARWGYLPEDYSIYLKIGHLTVQLVQMGRNTSFLSSKTKVRQIGESLNRIGGIAVMRGVYYTVKPILEEAMARELEAAWNGIGDWQS